MANSDSRKKTMKLLQLIHILSLFMVNLLDFFVIPLENYTRTVAYISWFEIFCHQEVAIHIHQTLLFYTVLTKN